MAVIWAACCLNCKQGLCVCVGGHWSAAIFSRVLIQSQHWGKSEPWQICQFISHIHTFACTQQSCMHKQKYEQLSVNIPAAWAGTEQCNLSMDKTLLCSAVSLLISSHFFKSHGAWTFLYLLCFLCSFHLPPSVRICACVCVCVRPCVDFCNL